MRTKHVNSRQRRPLLSAGAHRGACDRLRHGDDLDHRVANVELVETFSLGEYRRSRAHSNTSSIDYLFIARTRESRVDEAVLMKTRPHTLTPRTYVCGRTRVVLSEVQLRLSHIVRNLGNSWNGGQHCYYARPQSTAATMQTLVHPYWPAADIWWEDWTLRCIILLNSGD